MHLKIVVNKLKFFTGLYTLYTKKISHYKTKSSNIYFSFCSLLKVLISNPL